MALFSKCMQECAQKLLDTADIVNCPVGLLLFTAPTKWKKNGNSIETDEQDDSTECFAIVSCQSASDPKDAHDCRNWNYGHLFRQRTHK